jgi:hypothetical protein
MSQPDQEFTNHAMLVLWGHFAQQIGLIEALESVTLRQKRRDHTPQTKVIEFLVAILAGLPHLKDISQSAHPLDRDPATARAWRQPAWANYTGVSRTLSTMSMNEARQIVQVLDAISHPFITEEINRALLQANHLQWDVDLTGRSVSNSSTTYPDAAYGYMGDSVQLGYQAAMVSMSSPTYGRLWLCTTPHPGDTVSCTQAEASILTAEAKSGVRPRRRTELLAQRLAQAQEQERKAQERWQRAQDKLQQTQQQLAETETQIIHYQEQVTALEAEYGQRNRPERPHSQLAQTRRRLGVQQRRRERRRQALQNAQRQVSKKEAAWQETQAQVTTLNQRLQRFEQENATNPKPLPIMLRMDAGFGTGENIALLIEMGYDLYTKPQNHWVTTKLLKEIAENTAWERVGRNAEMTVCSQRTIPNCPYPMDIALERFHTGSRIQHSALLHYGNEPVIGDLTPWFQTYNGRQTIEAGIKEGKGVFQLHHFKVRSEAGLFLQEHFTAFAANFARWALHDLDVQGQFCPDDIHQPTFSGIKASVQVAAHTSARVIWQPDGCLLRFTDSSVFAGQSFQVGERAFQLPLPLFKSYDFAPP